VVARFIGEPTKAVNVRIHTLKIDDVIVQNFQITNALAAWIIDTGATHHFSCVNAWFISMRTYEVDITTANRSTKSAGIGDIKMVFGDYILMLYDVVYVPTLKVNIISPEQLKTRNHVGYTHWFPNRLFDGNTQKTIVEADSSSGLPVISSRTTPIDHINAARLHWAEIKGRPISLDLAHRRLGHISKERVKILAGGGATGLQLKPEKATEHKEFCDSCMAGQAHAMHFPNRPNGTLVRAERPYEMVHMDLLEAPAPALRHGYLWLFVIVDHATRWTWSEGLTHKNVIEPYHRWRAWIRNQHESQIGSINLKCVCLDNGGEFFRAELQEEWESEGIDVRASVAFAHNQNGRIERALRDIVTHAISILHAAKLPLFLWYEISRTVTYLRNVWPRRVLNWKTPYELIHKRPPDLAHLRVLGSKAWILIPKPSREHKFAPRCIQGRLVGYDGSNQYIFWHPGTEGPIHARDVTINEWDVQYEGASAEFVQEDDDLSHLHLVSDNFQTTLNDQHEDLNQKSGLGGENGAPSTQDISTIDVNDVVDDHYGIVEGERPVDRLADGRDSDFVPSITAQPNHPPALNRRSRRALRQSQKKRDNQISIDELPLEDSPHLNTIFISNSQEFPNSFKEAMQRPDAKNWRQAVNREITQLLLMQTWVEVQRSAVPKAQRILQGRWVFVIKRNGLYKARFVVKGYEQVFGIDYQETFAAVARAESFRLLIAIAAQLGWLAENIDIDTAFLYEDIDTELYIELPEGHDRPRYLVGKLLKSLYGLKQAPRIWMETLSKCLTELGLVRMDSFPSVFFKQDGDDQNDLQGPLCRQRL
jgi:hypothetical protein